MTDHQNSIAPNDEELLRYALDGESLPRVELEHLEQCEICQRRLSAFKYANDFLAAKLYRSQCPTSTELSYYCADTYHTGLNLLSFDDRMRIARHILECPLCAEEAKETRHEFATTDLFPEETLPTFWPRVTIRRIVASLIPIRPQLATRSNSQEKSQIGWPRQYHADGIDLSLHLSRGSKGELLLLGLLSSNDPNYNIEDFEGCLVDLYRTPGPLTPQRQQVSRDGQVIPPLRSTQVDDLGNIVFKAVPTGECIMIIKLPDIEMVIEGLAIEHN